MLKSFILGFVLDDKRKRGEWCIENIFGLLLKYSTFRFQLNKILGLVYKYFSVLDSCNGLLKWFKVMYFTELRLWSYNES